VLEVVRSILNWHATRTDDFNPPFSRGMKRGKKASRERILNDDELRLIWKAAESSTSVFGAIVLMCLLTAQRSRKVASMKWSDLDLKSGTWSIPREPRAKETGGDLVLPDAALAIIEARPRLASNPYVFAGYGGGPFRGWSSRKRAFDGKLPAGMAQWQLHDLRRTARSLMSRAGVSSEHAERVMGHTIGGVEGTYDRHHYREEKSAALKRLAALLDDILRERSAVVPLKAASMRKTQY
jgi:integrase